MQDTIDCPCCEALRARLAALVERHEREDARGSLRGEELPAWALLAELRGVLGGDDGDRVDGDDGDPAEVSSRISGGAS